MYRTIFLRENEKDIFQALKAQGIKTKVFEHHLAHLFNRVYNNYVGYYTFKQEETIYKMIVLPKTIEPNEDAEKKFVDYLLHYYRVNNIYGFDKENKIPNSLLQLVFKENNSQHTTHNILDEFQFYKYSAILQAIESFFKRHKNAKRVSVDYVAQSIKHKLNLKQNIREIDKTKIYQTQKVDVVFSLLATIAFNALAIFISSKLQTIEEENRKKLFKEIERVKNFIAKKYHIEKGYRLTITSLHGIKIEKNFAKKQEHKELLINLKSLFGFEQMYKDSSLEVDYKQDLLTHSLFINPNNFYEWYVYDELIKQYDKEQVQRQQINKYTLAGVQRDSKPDFVVTKNKKIIVIDAKWKILKSLSEISFSDVAKLRRDSMLVNGNKALLVYPSVGFEIRDEAFELSVDGFWFRIKVIKP